MKNKFKKLKEIFQDAEENVLLKDYTTFKIGGPAKYFLRVKTRQDLCLAVKAAKKLRLLFFILGAGSNILVSDKGFDGLVIKNEISFIEILRESGQLDLSEIKKIKRSLIKTKPVSKIDTLSFSDLDYEEKGKPVLVRAGSGISLGYLLDYTLKKNITGLQWFAGIPGTVGGAVFVNAHGGTKYISDYVIGATLVSQSGELKKVDNSYFEFSYDKSILGKTKDIVIDVIFRLYKGNGEKAEKVAKEWLRRKCKIQERKNTPGCIFKNIHLSKKQIENLKKNKIGLTPEIIKNKILPAGWLIDRMGFRGKKIGQAQVSKKHANFIINLGQAKAENVLSLISLIKKKAKEKYNIQLEQEIGFVGFL